ncbi:hypothetical protein [Flavobacterium sp. LC2016-01]|nr:hypothetical protein [Flavobacterium sp. LC2016-01]
MVKLSGFDFTKAVTPVAAFFVFTILQQNREAQDTDIVLVLYL